MHLLTMTHTTQVDKYWTPCSRATWMSKIFLPKCSCFSWGEAYATTAPQPFYTSLSCSLCTFENSILLYGGSFLHTSASPVNILTSSLNISYFFIVKTYRFRYLFVTLLLALFNFNVPHLTYKNNIFEYAEKYCFCVIFYQFYERWVSF